MNLKQANWNVTKVVLLLTALGIAPAALAEDAGGYFGVSAGQASASDYCSDTGGLTVTSCDDSDTSFRIFGGARITPNVGIEAAYVNLGTYTGSVSGFGPAVRVETELTGFTVQGVGMVPFGNEFSLMGRVGIIFWDLNSSASASFASASVGDDGTDIALGVGAQYKFARNFGLRADVDFYPDLGNSTTGEDNITAFSIGAVFSF